VEVNGSDPAGAANLEKVGHVVVVMLENRSFDHMHLPPLYHQPSFVRHLDAHHLTWRWYSFDPETLRLADVHHRLGHHDRFGYFSKTGLPWKTIFDITCNPKIPSFLEDAAAGTLRQVSWIDPAFTNFNPIGFPVNDDHPPADVKDGQDLVLAIYDALAASPQWERTLLVVVYDEHGGFYDHDLQKSILAATDKLGGDGHPPDAP